MSNTSENPTPSVDEPIVSRGPSRPPAPALHARRRGARGRDARARRGRRRGDRSRGGRGRFNARGRARSRCCCRRSPRSPGVAARTSTARARARRRYSRRRSRPSRRRPPHPRAQVRAQAPRAPPRSLEDDAERRGDAGSGTERRQDSRPRALRRAAPQTTLPPVTSVWLITLSGSNFAQALAQTAAAPYIDSQLVPAGTLLSGWSSLDASAFASEAALLAGEPPQTLDSIVQPPCPEGAAGATVRARNRGRADGRRRIPESHRCPRSPRAPPTASTACRDHVRRGRQRHRVEPARRLRRPRRSAPSRPSACCCSRRSPAPARGRRRPSTRLPPSRAFPGFCTDAVSADRQSHVAI